MQSKVLLGNGKVNLIHELSVLAFQTLKNLPAAPPSGGTAGTGGCKQFTPPLLHGYTPCSGGVLGYAEDAEPIEPMPEPMRGMN